MSVTYINPGTVHTPAGAYSHASIAEGGRIAFIAGQIAVDPAGELVGGDDAGHQFRQAFANLVSICDELGAGPLDVLDLKTYVVGEESLPAWRAAREDVFTEHYPDGSYPPNTLLLVAGLASPEFKVEVSATVRLPG